MSFAYPWLLALAGLGLPVFAAAWWRRRGAFTVPTGRSFAAIRPTWRIRFSRALPLFRVVAIALLAVALARPRIGEANTIVPAEGIDIALSMDVSSSMLSEMAGAGGKSKLAVTKSVIRDFIEGRENDRIGFVVFQKDALALTPPTLDYAALDSVVAQTESGILPDGTGIGVGLASALNMLRDSNAASRVVILLTDGDHNATSISPEDAAELAAALRIRVYTIGVLDDDAFQPIGGIDEDRMRAIAERTGARYFAADSPTALADVYDEIGRLETSRVGREEFRRYDEYATWFAAAAAALLGFEFLLGASWLRRSPA